MAGIIGGMSGLILIHKELLYLEHIPSKLQEVSTCRLIHLFLQTLMGLSHQDNQEIWMQLSQRLKDS